LHQGIKTIGYGHNCEANKDSDKIHPPISIEEAEDLLRKDLVQFEDYVNNQVPFLNSNQFSAVVSFAFNLGCGNLGSSTLLKKLKEGEFDGASDEFGKWVYANKKKLPGLVRRREAERQLFLKE
jgi:lysozyme